MIIKLHGETSPNKLTKIIKEVVSDIQKRADLQASKFTLKDVEIGVLFEVNGEKMMLNSSVDGVVEPFVVHVQLDKKGNIEVKKDNDEVSFADDFTKSVTMGLDAEVNDPVESVFNDDDLEQDYEEEAGGLKAVYYLHKTTAERVVRYYRNGVLVGEMGYK